MAENEDDDGNWITTDGGKHIHFDAAGNIDKGYIGQDAVSKTEEPAQWPPEGVETEFEATKGVVAAATPTVKTGGKIFTAFVDYQNEKTYNKELRTKAYIPDEAKEQIQVKDDFFRKAPGLTKPVLLYRILGGEMADMFEVGVPFHDAGYMSTALTDKIKDDFERRGKENLTVMVEIVAPAGAKGIFLNKLLRDRPKERKIHTGEDEVLFPRDTGLYPAQKFKDGGMAIIRAIMIVPEGSDY